MQRGTGRTRDYAMLMGFIDALSEPRSPRAAAGPTLAALGPERIAPHLDRLRESCGEASIQPLYGSPDRETAAVTDRLSEVLAGVGARPMPAALSTRPSDSRGGVEVGWTDPADSRAGEALISFLRALGMAVFEGHFLETPRLWFRIGTTAQAPRD